MGAREWGMLLGAMARLLRDSDRLDDIHIVAEITGRRRLRALLDELEAADAAILRERPEIDERSVDFEALRRLPADSLGGAYVRHLDAHGLSIYRGPPSDRILADPDLRYLVHRYRQIHDIWHVLLGLGVAGHEEVLLHAFVFGLLGLPNSALIVLFGGIKHMVLERRWPALRHGLLEAYRNGRAAGPLLSVDWERRWAHRLDAVRAELGVRACTPAFVQARGR